MDNKQDRQFYWKVKEFLNNTPDIKPVTPKPNSLISSVNNILEQNKTYKQNNFNPNLGGANTIRQVIAHTARAEAKGTPGLPVFTKNVYNANPFQIIKEGIFDEVADRIKKLQGETGYDVETEEEINAAVAENTPEPGVPLTDLQRKLRDLQGEMKAQRDLQAAQKAQYDSEEAEAQAVGSTIKTTESGARYGEKPDFVKEREAAAQAASNTPEKPDSKPATPPATPPTPSTPTPEPEPEKDEELERLVGGRIKTRDLRRQKEMEQGEENLAYLKAKDTGSMTELQKSRHAQALVRAQRRAEGKAFNGPSDEQIRGQEQRGLERKREASNASMNSVEDIRARAAAERQAANKAKTTTTPSGGQGQTPPANGPGRDFTNLGLSQDQIDKANKEQSGKFAGDLTGVGSTPNPQAKAPMPTSSSGSQPAPTTGSSVGPVRSTGAEVSSKAGELMGLGSGSKPAPQTSTSGAAETLGLGSSQPAPEEESEAKKRARETLLK